MSQGREDGAAGSARELASLVRADPAEAARRLDAMPPAAAVAALRQVAPRARAELLAAAPRTAELVPLLPEIDLCATARAIGPAASGWLLEYASGDQIVACLDLDAWRGARPDPERIGEWLAAVLDAGERAVLRAVRALDAELLSLYVRAHLEVYFRRGDDDEWEPPDGTLTLDGQYHLRGRDTGQATGVPIRLLQVLLAHDQARYVELLHDVAASQTAEDEELALRWREGRLADLGFPSREEAGRIYARLRPWERGGLPSAAPRSGRGPERPDARLPVPPGRPLLPFPIFDAIAELTPDDRDAALVAFMELTNQVLVADELPLGDADAVRQAVERAATLASRGLEDLSSRSDLGDAEILRRVPLDHLFRLGADLEGAIDERVRRLAESGEGGPP